MLRRFVLVFILLSVVFVPSTIEAGNTCATATPVTEGVYPFDLSTSTEDSVCTPNANANWFLFTAPAVGIVTVETCGLTSVDTYVLIYDGSSCPTSCSGYIATDDDACGFQSRVTFEATRGATFLIMLRKYSGEGGTGSIRVLFDPLPGDTCEFAIKVSPNSSHEFNNALHSAGTDPCNSISRPVWYTFVAPSAGSVRIDTCGTDFDTVLTVFSGPGCVATCDPVTFNDDSDDCGLQAALDLPVTAGQRYYVSARGYQDLVGNIRLNLAFTPAAGDTCADAGVLLTSGLYPYDTTGAGGDDPCPIVFFPSVWYRFTPPADGLVLARLNDTSYAPFLRVFSGANCPLECSGVVVQGNPGVFSGGYMPFDASSGSTYHLSVTSHISGNSGPGVLGFTYIPVGGDFTNDGVVNVADVTEFARMLDNGMPLTPLVGDIDNNATVNWDDVQALAELVAN